MIKEGVDLWTDNCNYDEYQHDGGSNLYITWTGCSSELIAKLEYHQISEIRFVHPTNDDHVYNVVFENHSCARKAFTTQQEIGVRMVPPKGSMRNWKRNPSLKFLVKFETKCRLVVKAGKAARNKIVGVLLMSNSQEERGCYIWVDQLKGHRIRIVGVVGNFLLPNGRILQMNEVPKKNIGNKSLGWVFYRCKETKKEFVVRRSGNQLGDYMYSG